MKKRITAMMLCAHMVLFMMFQVASVVVAEDGNTVVEEEVADEEDIAVAADAAVDEEEGKESDGANSPDWISYEEFMLSETTKAWNDPDIYVRSTAEFNVNRWDGFEVTSGFTEDGFSNPSEFISYTELSDEDGKGLKVVITDFYHEKEADLLWYKVEAIEGDTLPDILVDNPYVLHLPYEEEEPALLMLPKRGMFVGETVIVQKQMVAASAYRELTVSELPEFFDIAWADDDVLDELEWYDLGDISGWSEVLTPEYRYVSASSVILIPAEVSRAYDTLMAADGTDQYYAIMSFIPEEVTAQFTDKHIANLEKHVEYLQEIENVEYTTNATIGGKEVPITVHGKIPQEGVTLTVAEAATEDVLSGGFDIKDASEIVTALDIKIINDGDGSEWQPEEGDLITVSIGMEGLGYQDGDIFRLHHKHGDDITVYEVFVVLDGRLTLGTNGFSLYVISDADFDETNPKYDGAKLLVNGVSGSIPPLAVGESAVYYVEPRNNEGINQNNMTSAWWVEDPEGAIYYEIYSTRPASSYGSNGRWIKVIALKETQEPITLTYLYTDDINISGWQNPNNFNGAIYQQSFELSTVSPKATAAEPKRIYLRDEVNTSGCIIATLVNENGDVIDGGLEGAAFSWKRMDGTKEMFIMPHAYENVDDENDNNPIDPNRVDNDRINIAKDHGGLLEAQKDTNGKYVPTVYSVTVTLADGTVLEDDYTVYYQSEIINSGFEAPDANSHTYTFFANGWPGMYWKTTAPGMGANLSRDVEYVDFTDNRNTTDPSFGVTDAAEKDQFAEVNAEAFGTLYQDIITAPGEEVSWRFSHAPRPNYSNKMYIVLGATEGAQKLITQEQLEALVDVARATPENSTTLNAGGCVTVKFNEDTQQQDENGTEYAIWYHEATQNGKWVQISGSYITPSKQYRTRVFFMSETPANKQNQNYGNLIDASKVGQYKKYLIEYYEETFGSYGTKVTKHKMDWDEWGEALVYSSVQLENLEHFITEENDHLQQILINGGNYPYNIRYAGDASIFIEKYPGTATDPFPEIGKSYKDYDIVVQIYLRDTVIAVQKEIQFPAALTTEQKLKIIEDLNRNGSYKASFDLTSVEVVDENGKYGASGNIPITHRDPTGKYTGYLSLGENPPTGHTYTVEETATTPIVGLELEKVSFTTTRYSLGKVIEVFDISYNEVFNNKTTKLLSDVIALNETARIAEVVVVNTYKEKKTQVYYQAVGNGKVALMGSTNFEDTPMEELEFYSGKAIGGAIHPGKNATFVGWYKNAECTEPVTAADGVWNKKDNSFKPNANIINADEITFYAKFETGSIVIERINGEPGQMFVYRIQGSDIADSNIEMYVTVECDATGKGSTTVYEVPSGSYTVTEMEDWSWRYPADKIGPTAAGTGVVTFSFGNTSNSGSWLNGYSDIEKNVYKGGS